MSRAYYNEIDGHAAQWLRNLITAGHIAPGDVDERSIKDVKAEDLEGYTQCHFFAGIGVWSYALRRAGWPDDRPIWSGSCPCQPFSDIGRRAGVADERHLYPAWGGLIEVRRPPVVFGEQVEAAIRHGWLDAVQSHLEGLGYAFAAIVLPAAGFGAPNGRHRIFFVGDALSKGLEGHAGHGGHVHKPGWLNQKAPRPVTAASHVGGFWADAEWVACTDGRRRPIKPGVSPLAHGDSGRVVKLRAYGNSINTEVATEFIRAYMQERGLK